MEKIRTQIEELRGHISSEYYNGFVEDAEVIIDRIIRSVDDIEDKAISCCNDLTTRKENMEATISELLSEVENLDMQIEEVSEISKITY